jgi:hypothetical protein
VKDNKVVFGKQWSYQINDKICCSTATYHAAIAPQLDKLMEKFGREKMGEAFRRWLYASQNLGDDEKGPIAVVTEGGSDPVEKSFGGRPLRVCD